MCIIQKLPDVKAEIIKRVKIAARNGNIAEISRWGKAAEKCHLIIQEAMDFENRARNFIDSIRYGQESFTEETINVKKQVREGLSAKQEGAQKRGEWIKKLSSKGIVINGHGKNYRTQSDHSVGIAFANELDKPQLVDKWFLGLKDEPVDVVVLLCRDKEGNMHDFILPFGKMGSLWEKLSRSKGQVKFHVQRLKGEFMLLVPGADPLNIFKYYGNYQVLKELGL